MAATIAPSLLSVDTHVALYPTSIKGGFTPQSEEVVTWSQPGVDGQGVMRMGRREGRAVLRVVYINTVANCDVFKSALAAYQGDYAYIKLDTGIYNGSALVVEASPQSETALYHPTLGALRRIEWRLVVTT